MKWKTVRNNHIDHWTGSLRVVWQDRGSDVCYVVPCDGDNGNATAMMIASLPDVFLAAINLCDLILQEEVMLDSEVVRKAVDCKQLITRSGFGNERTK